MFAGGTVALAGGLWSAACAAPPPPPAAAPVPAAAPGRVPAASPSPTLRSVPGRSPYGPPGPPNADGLCLPEGFTGRVIARSRHEVAGLIWHDAPDGGACFPDGSGWIYVSNSEVEKVGGVSAIRFRADGEVDRAYRILSGTDRNCAGGATPWGTWLSCEEVDRGYVYETDPYGVRRAVRRPALGRFRHEAAACDPEREVVYLTEDEPDGGFYRFTPDRWPDLSSGILEILVETGDGVAWRRVPDPAATRVPTRRQRADTMRFDGGEGCYYADGVCYFTTKGDNRVWGYDARRHRLDLVYGGEGTLAQVDNITGSSGGDLYVAEDGGNMEINIITPDGTVAPFLRLVGQDESEICGPAFSPDGTRLYFSSQRGTTGKSSGGITYEVTGPFRTAR